jgi:hypothetical protein
MAKKKVSRRGIFMIFDLIWAEVCVRFHPVFLRKRRLNVAFSVPAALLSGQRDTYAFGN